MHVDFPTNYAVDYPDKNINYYDAYGQRKLIPLLLKASGEFCMYCGKSLKKDTDLVYHVEHSVDREGNLDQKKDEKTFLTHCKYNLAIACTTCNIECKKRVEKITFGSIPHIIDCRHIKCLQRCAAYDSLREQYMKKNAIILQPEGVNKDGKKYSIVYNLITQVYEPKDCRNDWEAFFYISNHILRFKLNSERYSEEFINRSADVVNLYRRGITSKNDLISSIQERENNNVLGVIFLNWFQRILEVNSVSEVVDVCEIIVVASALL